VLNYSVLIRFAIATAVLAGTSGWLPAQDQPDQARLALKFARHFEDRPPVTFELEATGDHPGRILVTNALQYPLTAIAIEIASEEGSKLPAQTHIYDALTRSQLSAPIARGLTFVTYVGHTAGKTIPNAIITAAIWEDGSTYGPSDVLNLILEGRRNTLAAFDRTLSILQSGIDADWTSSRYLTALEAEKQPNMGLSGMNEYQTHVAATAVVYGAESTIRVQAEKGKNLAHIAKVLQHVLKQQRDQLADSAPAL